MTHLGGLAMPFTIFNGEDVTKNEYLFNSLHVFASSSRSNSSPSGVLSSLSLTLHWIQFCQKGWYLLPKELEDNHVDSILEYKVELQKLVYRRQRLRNDDSYRSRIKFSQELMWQCKPKPFNLSVRLSHTDCCRGSRNGLDTFFRSGGVIPRHVTHSNK